METRRIDHVVVLDLNILRSFAASKTSCSRTMYTRPISRELQKGFKREVQISELTTLRPQNHAGLPDEHRGLVHKKGNTQQIEIPQSEIGNVREQNGRTERIYQIANHPSIPRNSSSLQTMSLSYGNRFLQRSWRQSSFFFLRIIENALNLSEKENIRSAAQHEQIYHT